MQNVLVTGSAGFIGFHLSRLLLDEGLRVHGFDGMTEYYDVTLKQRRHGILHQMPGFSATEGMLEDQALLDRVADDYFGRDHTILKQRNRIKRKAIETRRLLHRKSAA